MKPSVIFTQFIVAGVSFALVVPETALKNFFISGLALVAAKQDNDADLKKIPTEPITRPDAQFNDAYTPKEAALILDLDVSVLEQLQKEVAEVNALIMNPNESEPIANCRITKELNPDDITNCVSFSAENLQFDSNFIVVGFPASNELHTPNTYVLVYLPKKDSEFEIENKEGEKEFEKRGIFDFFPHRALKRAFLYNGFNKTLVKLNTVLSESEEKTTKLSSKQDKWTSKFLVLKAAAKEKGLRMLQSSSVLVSHLNVKPHQEKEQLLKRTVSSDFSAMSYAFQRLDGDSRYGDGESKVLMDSKHRIYTDRLIAREEEPLGKPNNEEAEFESEESGTEDVLTNPEKESEKQSQSSENDPGLTGGKKEDDCVPVTWYSIFHHSVFGTPKLCQ